MPLPKKNIDTGMGLERTAACLQGVSTVFEIDIFRPIVAAVADVLGVKYDRDHPDGVRIRRMADHGRALTFCIHENVRPVPRSRATSSAACSAGRCSTPTRWAAASRSCTSSSRSWPR